MKLGFIGAGNMAKAMMGGIVASGLATREEVLASDPSEQVRDAVRDRFGVQVTADNRRVARECGQVVLAVKPQVYASVIEEIRDELSPETLVLSIAPGKSLQTLEELFGKAVKLVRLMPNTPAMVREGMTAVCPNGRVTPAELKAVCALAEGFGRAAAVPERLMEAVVAVSGSAPAYVFLFIEALADGAVREGMPRDMAYHFAAQAVLGSAKMVLETGIHPGALKDMVCSPAGTTIEAVRVLEEKGLRSCVIEAMRACAEKSAQM